MLRSTQIERHPAQPARLPLTKPSPKQTIANVTRPSPRHPTPHPHQTVLHPDHSAHSRTIPTLQRSTPGPHCTLTWLTPPPNRGWNRAPNWDWTEISTTKCPPNRPNCILCKKYIFLTRNLTWTAHFRHVFCPFFFRPILHLCDHFFFNFCRPVARKQE